MTITLGPWVFDNVFYDEEADVAYLSIGPPHKAVGEETPEGHVAMYDVDTGEFCGLTIIGLRHIIDSEGECNITVPNPPSSMSVDADELRDLVPA